MSSGSWTALRAAYDEALARRDRGDEGRDLLTRVLREHDVAPIWTRAGSARDLLESAFCSEVPQQRLRTHMLRGLPGLMRDRRHFGELAVLRPEAVMDRGSRQRSTDAWWAIPDERIPLSHVSTHPRRGWRPGRTSTALVTLPFILDWDCGGGLDDCLQFAPDSEGWHNVQVWLHVTDPDDVVSITDAGADEHYLLDVMVGHRTVGETLVPIQLARVLAGLAAADVVSDGLLQVNLDPMDGKPYVGRMRCHLPD